MSKSVCLHIQVILSYISVDLAHHEIFRAKVGKGGIILVSKSVCLHIQVILSYISVDLAHHEIFRA